MKNQTRRQFMLTATTGLAATAAMGQAPGGQAQQVVTAREYLKEILYKRQEVDDWFAGKAFPFSKHDPELGWLLRDARFADGVDGSASEYHYGKYDERIMTRYADRACRINTYGDSFTQCHQVNDGETWQEMLAARLQEPVRNFGVGGYSVYQAYRRMKREEARVPAQYIILNIYDDDHYRNLDSWRNIRVRKHPQHIESTLPHVVVNPGANDFRECENPCPTKEDYYRLCDLDWVERRFKDDFVLGVMLAHANAKAGNPEHGLDAVRKLATTHGIATRLDDSASLDVAAQDMFTAAALFSTMKIVEMTEEFAKQNGKQVLYVLSFNAATIATFAKEGTRFDQPFVDFLKARNLPFVDLLDVHMKDFASFSIPFQEYLKRYYIGHYNPWGNMFEADAINKGLLPLLNPKPAAYSA